MERIGEVVTGHLPLERVAPHEVGAGEILFPTDETELIKLGLSGENPPKLPWAGNCLLIFAGQHQHVVCEVEGNFIQREICEFDFLGEDNH